MSEKEIAEIIDGMLTEQGVEPDVEGDLRTRLEQKLLTLALVDVVEILLGQLDVDPYAVKRTQEERYQDILDFIDGAGEYSPPMGAGLSS